MRITNLKASKGWRLVLLTLVLAVVTLPLFSLNALALAPTDGGGFSDNPPVGKYRDPDFIAKKNFSDPKATGAAAGPMAVADLANVLTDSEEQKLTERITEIEKKYKYDIGIVFTTRSGSTDSMAREYTEAYYLGAKYGADDKRTGILMLVSVEDRKLTIWTDGKALKAFTVYGLHQIFGDVKAELKDNNWYDASQVFVEDCDEFMAEAAKGTPYDENHKRVTTGNILTVIGFGVLGGLFISGVMTFIIYRRHRTAPGKSGAMEYLMPGTLHVAGGQDIFVDSYVTSVRKSKESSSSSSGGSVGSGSSGGRGISGSF